AAPRSRGSPRRVSARGSVSDSTSESPPPKSRPRDLSVIEWERAGADDLVGLVPFPRDQESVSGSGHVDGGRDCQSPIRDRPHVGRSTHSRLDLAQDRSRVLAPWVIGREDHLVREPCRGGTHQRSLAPIAVSSATEDAQKPLGTEFPYRLEGPAQRVRRVCVIVQHLKGLYLYRKRVE